MIPMLRKPNIFQSQSGSALLAALTVLALTSLIVGAALFEAGHRFRTAQHSLRWVQASHAAEAGAELALLSAQKNSWIADGWSSAPGAPGSPAVVNTFVLSNGVPATLPVSASVSVEKITMGTAEWLRIRSTGHADVSGGAVADVDRQDVMLRKLSLRADRTTGASVAVPRATRTVEILAELATKSPFHRPILMDKEFTMSGGWVDSFDSADPLKSTAGLYDILKRQWNGHVGINDTQGSSDFGGAFVYGDVAYSGPAPTGATNVQGTITAPFSDPVLPVLAPVWATFNPTPAVIGTTMTLSGGTEAAPARYQVSSVTVSGGKVLTIATHAAGEESYIEIWVTGNFTTSGSGYILQQPGVHVTYHIEGDVTVSGSSFNNQSNVAANNIMNVITPAVGVNQKVIVSGGGTFIGAINAPGAAFTTSGGANFSGAIIGKTMSITGGGSVHYDEALMRVPGSAGGSSYRVRSWVEAVR